METKNAMNKYKGKVDNISFDVAKGARERYKRIAKESDMKLGEFVITAMEEYIRLHDLDTVDTYGIRPDTPDLLIWLESQKCYFPITAETKQKLDSGAISGIDIHENNLQISGIDWSVVSYNEKSNGISDNSESIQVGCPIPMISKASHDTDQNDGPETIADDKKHLLAWYSIFRNMFSVNSETNRITYKLDHQPYKIIRNTETDPQYRPGQTEILSSVPVPESFKKYDDEKPVTQKDLADTLPGLIEQAVKKYLSR